MAKENFFQKAKQDGQVFFKTVNLVTRLSKLKMAIRAKKQEREKLLRTVGVSIFEIYHADRSLDSQKITNAVSQELSTIQDIDNEVKDLEAESEQVKADFRQSHGQNPPETPSDKEQK
jgi:hypothetical protein